MREQTWHTDATSIERGVFMREDELARRWRISLRTLQRWRLDGRAPPHLRLGRSVLYRRMDVDAFEAHRLSTREGE